MPVVLFLARLSDERIFRKALHTWFADADRRRTRKVFFDKTKDALNKDALPGLVATVASFSAPGRIVPSTRMVEMLNTNLLKVSFPARQLLKDLRIFAHKFYRHDERRQTPCSIGIARSRRSCSSFRFSRRTCRCSDPSSARRHQRTHAESFRRPRAAVAAPTQSPARVSGKREYPWIWLETFGHSGARVGEVRTRRRKRMRENPLFSAFSRASWETQQKARMAGWRRSADRIRLQTNSLQTQRRTVEP